MNWIFAEGGEGTDPAGRTCCLTGHRSIPPGETDAVMARTETILRRLIREKGVCYFGVGGAVGFDMLAAELLLKLKEREEPGIRVISVLPWPGWRETGDWTAALRRREDRILKACDKVVYVSPEYVKKVFLLRDRRLVEGSGFCVCYCNRLRTGTAYTVRYALEHGLEVYNTCGWDPKNVLVSG